MSERSEVPEYRFTVYADVDLTRTEAGKLQALLNAGISKANITRIAFKVLLSKSADELLALTGLKTGLENPETIPITEYSFRKIEKR